MTMTTHTTNNSLAEETVREHLKTLDTMDAIEEFVVGLAHYIEHQTTEILRLRAEAAQDA